VHPRFPNGPVLWPRVVLRSQEQTHYFNCPYQLASADFASAAADADLISCTAREGDILVAATDGVLDNLFDRQLQIAVLEKLEGLFSKDATKAQQAIDGLAAAIAHEAALIGGRQDEEGLRTPFQAAAAQEGYHYPGGKLDDVAVVCGVVRSGAKPPPRAHANFELAKFDASS